MPGLINTKVEIRDAPQVYNNSSCRFSMWPFSFYFRVFTKKQWKPEKVEHRKINGHHYYRKSFKCQFPPSQSNFIPAFSLSSSRWIPNSVFWWSLSDFCKSSFVFTSLNLKSFSLNSFDCRCCCCFFSWCTNVARVWENNQCYINKCMYKTVTFVGKTPKSQIMLICFRPKQLKLIIVVQQLV